MNEPALRRALKQYVLAHQTEWLQGLRHGGVDRSFSTVAVSRFVPPQGGYHLCAYVTGAAYRTERTVNAPAGGRYEYRCALEVADYLFSLPEEDSLYETMTMDFLLLRDRIVTSLADSMAVTRRLTDEIDNVSFTFNQVSLDVSTREEFALTNIPVIFSSISFTMRGC